MSSASLRLTEPCIFLVGGLDWERARQRQRRAAQRAANAANTPTNAGPAASATVGSPSQSRHPSPDRDRGSRAASLSRPGSRAASPAPRGRLGELAQQGTDEFVPPNSRGRSHSRTRQPTPTGNRTHSLSRGRDGSLVRDMTDAQLALQQERDEREDLDEPPPALLRGLLTVHLSKPTRIKEISVRFKGTARTDWPEGIGPRRLDVMEETQLINVTQSFFSASSASMQRRAASIGPGAGDHGDEMRGRSTRRAASVVPGRQVSQGRSYPRDSIFQQHDAAPAPLHQHAPEVARAPGLSRISSEEDLGDHRIPPVLPGEAAPSYEVAVDSAPGSPMHLPASSNHSVDTLDLGTGLSAAFRSTHRIERSPTPSRSPLATSNPITSPAESPSGSSGHLPLARTTTRASRLSHDSTETTSSAHSSGTDRPALDRQLSSGTGTSNTASLSSDPEHHGPGWQSAPVPGSTASSFGRGRSPDREASGSSAASNGVDGATNGVAGMTFQSRSSTSRQAMSPAASSATGTDRRRRTSSSSATTTRRLSSNTERPSALPSALKSNSGSSGGGGGRSISRGARFTLSGITEVLRGKSSSRARNGNGTAATAADELHAPAVPRRTSSPDARAGSSSSRMRSQSRGRKTALKALRDALVVGHHSSHGDRDGSDDDRHGSSGGGGSEVVGDGWKEFKAGTYTYPISITVPATLPPSMTCEFGHVGYALKATVHRAGALTTNLTSSTEVTLVTTPGEEDTEESESIVVERFWETQVKYHVALSGKSFPIGGQIPISIRLNPLAKIRLYRVTAQLEQKTSYFASVNSGRKLTRHETPKRFQLLRIENKDPKEPLLPILSDDPDVLLNHPLRDFFINASSSDDDTPSLLDPIGPWHLDGLLQLPDCSSKLCVSTHHEKSNISISHTLKIMMRVERGDDEYLDSKGNRKLWDIVVEAGAVMLSCRLAQNVLPAYSDATPSLAGPSGSSSRSSRNNTSRGTTHDCGAAHPPPLTRAANMHIGMGSSTTHRSHSTTAAPIATLEQNLLLARLIAGETTPAGETPPTYDAVVDGSAPLGRGRATEVVEVEAEEVERGRSSSTRRGTARA